MFLLKEYFIEITRHKHYQVIVKIQEAIKVWTLRMSPFLTTGDDHIVQWQVSHQGSAVMYFSVYVHSFENDRGKDVPVGSCLRYELHTCCDMSLYEHYGKIPYSPELCTPFFFFNTQRVS